MLRETLFVVTTLCRPIWGSTQKYYAGYQIINLSHPTAAEFSLKQGYDMLTSAKKTCNGLNVSYNLPCMQGMHGTAKRNTEAYVDLLVNVTKLIL